MVKNVDSTVFSDIEKIENQKLVKEKPGFLNEIKIYISLTALALLLPFAWFMLGLLGDDRIGLFVVLILLPIFIPIWIVLQVISLVFFFKCILKFRSLSKAEKSWVSVCFVANLPFIAYMFFLVTWIFGLFI